MHQFDYGSSFDVWLPNKLNKNRLNCIKKSRFSNKLRQAVKNRYITTTMHANNREAGKNLPPVTETKITIPSKIVMISKKKIGFDYYYDLLPKTQNIDSDKYFTKLY